MINKQRYGIRKYKIGATSIALGAVVVIGMTDGNEAEASEVSGSQRSLTELQDNKSFQSRGGQDETLQSLQTNLKKDNSNVNSTNDNDSIQQSVLSVSNDNNPKMDVHQPQKMITEVAPSKVMRAPQKYSKESSFTPTESDRKGIDVSNKVNVLKSSIEGHEGQKNITPHNAERITLKYEWKFDNSIKENDYFDFKLSNNVDTLGIAVKKKVPEIKDNENIVARGEVMENNNIRYTFTEYVNYKKDITAKLSLNLFFNPVSVPKAGAQTVTAQLGKNETKETFNVKYLDGVVDKTGSGVRINGRIHKLNKEDQNFTHIAYINPDRRKMHAVDVIGYFYKGSTEVSYPRSVQVYEYVGEKPLAQSVYADFNVDEYKDVTKDVRLNVQENGNYKIILNDISGKAYLIKFVGQYSEDAKDLSFATELTGHYLYNGFYRSSKLTWLNGAAFYSNNAQGSGSNRLFTGQSEYVNFFYDTYKPEQHFQIGSLEESYDSKPSVSISESGKDYGSCNHIIEEIEDTIEYMTEENLIEFNEENTLPPSISGQASRSVEEIEDSHLIEFDHLSGTGEIKGTNEKTIEEIVEKNVIDFVIESGNEKGSNENIVFEEETDNDKPFYRLGAHDPIEFVENTISHVGGFNNGCVEEEDTVPNNLVPPTPKEEKPEIPSTPEVPKLNDPNENIETPPTPKAYNDNPKIEKNIVPKSPNSRQEHQPKIKTEQPHLTNVVSEKPKFKKINFVQTNTSNKTTESKKEVTISPKELPNTGSHFEQRPLILGGLLSLFGLALLRRSKKVIK